MKVLHGAVALLVALVCFTGVGLAEDKKDKKKNATMGVIESVDSTAKTVTVKTGKKNDTTTVTFKVTEATKISVENADGKKDGTWESLSAGKRVMITKETKDGKDLAATITVVDGKKKKNDK